MTDAEPGSGEGAGAGGSPGSTPGPPDVLLEALGVCTESGRLERARELAADVVFQVADPPLALATVSSYNVVIDGDHHKIVHACRDFRTQAPAGMLCKHVAAVLLAMEAEQALPVARNVADPDGGWRLENIRRFK